jgi:hypothetical protein
MTSNTVAAGLLVIGLVVGAAVVYGGISVNGWDAKTSTLTVTRTSTKTTLEVAYVENLSVITSGSNVTSTTTVTSSSSTVASSSSTGANIDGFIGQFVNSSDMATLCQLSLGPYGPSDTSMLSLVQNYSGSPFTAEGKPVVVFIGAEYCPYCAVQIWPLIMALMRFGNLSSLIYMASSPSKGDYPTFSFLNSTYTSNYLVFQGFEQFDRNYQPLQTVPSNYTAVFDRHKGYPFLDFGNKYIVEGSMLEPEALGGENWTGVLNDINTSTTIGRQIKESANAITALICELTNGQPSTVCDQSPINTLTISVASFGPASPEVVAQATPPESAERPPNGCAMRFDGQGP